MYLEHGTKHAGDNFHDSSFKHGVKNTLMMMEWSTGERTKSNEWTDVKPER